MQDTRFNLHKRSLHPKYRCNNPNNNQYNSKLYKTIQDNGSFSNWTIETVENYVDCNSLDDARARERYWCEELQADFNKNKPLIADDEYKNYQREYQKDYQKDYQREYQQGEKYKNYQREY